MSAVSKKLKPSSRARAKCARASFSGRIQGRQPGISVRHAAEAEPRNFEAGPAELYRLHEFSRTIPQCRSSASWKALLVGKERLAPVFPAAQDDAIRRDRDPSIVESAGRHDFLGERGVRRRLVVLAAAAVVRETARSGGESILHSVFVGVQRRPFEMPVHIVATEAVTIVRLLVDVILGEIEAGRGKNPRIPRRRATGRHRLRPEAPCGRTGCRSRLRVARPRRSEA